MKEEYHSMPPRVAASLSLAAFVFSSFFFVPPAVSCFSASSSSSTVGMPPVPAVRPHALHRYFILRHGETDCNFSGTIQGSADISRLAARAGATVFGSSSSSSKAPLTIHNVYVSPLTRARQTLSLVRQHALPGRIPSDGETVWHELREIDLYEWEGKNTSELKIADPDAYKAWVEGDAHGSTVSGRKPILETWVRAGRVWDTLRSRSSKSTTTTTTTTTSTPAASSSTNTLIVAHGTLGQALLCTAFGWEAATHFRLHNFPNCGLVEIMWRGDQDTATSWRWHHPEPSELNHVDTTVA